VDEWCCYWRVTTEGDEVLVEGALGKRMIAEIGLSTSRIWCVVGLEILMTKRMEVEVWR
jgi:hypothetical protein